MLDEILIQFNKSVYAAGPNTALLILFGLALLSIPLGFLALFIPKLLLHAFRMFMTIVLTYFLFSAFPNLLFEIYLNTGLITEDYLRQTPEPYRFISLYGLMIFTLGIGWLILSLAKDLLRGEPLTARKIAEKRFLEAEETSRMLK